MSAFAISSRAAHDVGLSAWFGGTLANAVALNAASAKVTEPQQAGQVANAGWDRWTPVNAVAIGAHLLGSVAQIVDIARAYFAARSRAAAEKYFWKNSLAVYKWKKRAKNQPSLG